MVTRKQQLVHSRAATNPGTNGRKTITIHETANVSRGAGAQAHANLQSRGNSRQASWHWQVDDKEAIQSFPHTVRCWHAGAGEGNNHSIAIEICVNSDGNFRKAVENAAALTRWIMQQENISINNVVQHNRWSGKNCPTNLRNGSKGINWNDFIGMVKGATVKPAAPSDPMDKGYLVYNDRGASVLQLAKDLQYVGYDVEPIDFFNAKLKRALMTFQKAQNLAVDGSYGPATQKALAKVVKDLKAAETASTGGNKEEDITVADILKLSTKEGANARLRVLKRFENKDPGLAELWRKKAENGEFTLHDGQEVMFVAIDRGYITGLVDTADLLKRIEELEKQLAEK